MSRSTDGGSRSRTARVRFWPVFRCARLWVRAVPGKVCTVFRPEPRQNKRIESFRDSKKREKTLDPAASDFYRRAHRGGVFDNALLEDTHIDHGPHAGGVF